MEHTLAVVDLCDRAARIRPELDRDLLVTAAVLHDVGMVDALDHDTTVRLNDRGRLVGHVATIYKWQADDQKRKIELPK